MSRRFAFGYFLLFSNLAIIGPYLQVFLSLQGYSKATIGVMLGTFEMAGVAGPLLIGHIADRNGRYRSLLAWSVGLALLVFVPLRIFVNPLVALITLVPFGMLYKSTIPLTDAIVTRTLSDPAVEYGRVRVFGSVGFVFMSVLIQLSGILAPATATVILLCNLLTGSAFLLSLFLFPSGRVENPTKPDETSTSKTGTIDPLFWVGIAAIFFARMGITAHYSFFSIFLEQKMGIQSISGIWAIGSIAEMPVILFGGVLLKKFRTEGLLALSFLAISLRIFGYSLLPPVPVLVALQLLHGLTFGGLHMASVNLVNTYTSRSRRALGMGLYVAVGTGLSAFIASAAGGIILEKWGFAAMFRLYSTFPLLGLVLLPVLRLGARRKERHNADSQ